MLGSPWTGYILIPQSLFPTTTRTWCSTRGAWSWDQNWQSTRPICWLPIPCPKWASFPKFVSRTDVLPRRSEIKPTSKEANRIPFSTKGPLPIYHLSIKPGSFKWESGGEIGYWNAHNLIRPSFFHSTWEPATALSRMERRPEDSYEIKKKLGEGSFSNRVGNR